MSSLEIADYMQRLREEGYTEGEIIDELQRSGVKVTHYEDSGDDEEKNKSLKGLTKEQIARLPGDLKARLELCTAKATGQVPGELTRDETNCLWRFFGNKMS